jgi:hypothetical protein
MIMLHAQSDDTFVRDLVAADIRHQQQHRRQQQQDALANSQQGQSTRHESHLVLDQQQQHQQQQHTLMMQQQQQQQQDQHLPMDLQDLVQTAQDEMDREQRQQQQSNNHDNIHHDQLNSAPLVITAETDTMSAAERAAAAAAARLCQHPGCKTQSRTRGLCYRHGGGKKECQWKRCDTPRRGGGLCQKHLTEIFHYLQDNPKNMLNMARKKGLGTSVMTAVALSGVNSRTLAASGNEASSVATIVSAVESAAGNPRPKRRKVIGVNQTMHNNNIMVNIDVSLQE